MPLPETRRLTCPSLVTIDKQTDRKLRNTANMNTRNKSLIRALVLAGLIAWPTIETCRLWASKQKLEEAQALQRSVQIKLEAARAKNVQVAGSTEAPGTK